MVAMAQITILCFHVWELKHSHRKTSIHGNPPFTKFNVAIHNRNGNSSNSRNQWTTSENKQKSSKQILPWTFLVCPLIFSDILALKKRLDCFCLGTFFFRFSRGTMHPPSRTSRFRSFRTPARSQDPSTSAWRRWLVGRLVGCPIYFPDGLTIHPRWWSFSFWISEPSTTYLKITINTWFMMGWAFLGLIGLNGRSFHSFHITSCFNCGEPDIFRSPPMTKSGLNLKPAFIREHTIHGTGIFTYMNGWFLW